MREPQVLSTASRVSQSTRRCAELMDKCTDWAAFGAWLCYAAGPAEEGETLGPVLMQCGEDPGIPPRICSMLLCRKLGSGCNNVS